MSGRRASPFIFFSQFPCMPFTARAFFGIICLSRSRFPPENLYKSPRVPAEILRYFIFMR